MRKKRGYIVAVVLILFLILANSFTTIINFITDYKWFKELGYTKTFLTKILTQLKIGIPTFVIIFGIIYSYIMFIKKRYYKKSNINPPKDGEKRLNLVFGLATALISLFVSTVFSSNLWFTILQFINGTNFNLKDPIFSKDLSFYMFRLPLFKEVASLLFLVIIMMIILTVGLYMVMFTFRRSSQSTFDNENIFDMNGRPIGKNINTILNKKAFKNALFQIGILGFLVFIIVAINYFLNTYELLYSPRGVAYGASFTDVHVTLWVYRIMTVVAIISAIGFLLGIMKKDIKKALIGPVVLIAISIIGNVGSGIVQKFIVEPDEISKEQKYLEYNIEYTQNAYGLNEVEQKQFPVSQDLTKEDLIENQDTVNNIRINDYRPIIQVYNQLQAIRLYYSFNNVDIDRYNIDGKYTQVFLSARELDQKNLQTKTWINKHLKYTHGYGMVLSPVNAVTSDGQPELLVRNIPPVTDVNLDIKRPEIYFGESTNDYIITNTDEMEFDYPQGSDNKQTIYEGDAGIELGGINKLLYAIKQKSFKILISNNVNTDSRIVLYRNINQRIRKIAPFIEYDENPYLVLNQDDGKLYWIIDGYTVSDKYPYSEPFAKESSLNYIRNSVKVVVDAYNGTVKYYVFDEKDPIIQTYRKIFPDLFLDKSEMPKGIMSHTRYPNLLFNIQAEVYRTYHVDNPMVFYNEEDFWDIAQEKYMESIQYVEPTYLMFKLPGEDKVEFLLTVPYTPKTKPNMTSLFVARNDGEDYGRLFIYKFPKGKTIDGPMMIESRIDQNTDISQQLTLWSQKGSAVLRGNVIIVPIENSLLYVEPIYLQADNENSLPEMKRVIVSFKDKIVMERNLDEALIKIFGATEEDIDQAEQDQDTDIDIEDQDVNNLVKKANELFNNAKRASQDGNWSEYGRYIEELEGVLKQLNNNVGVDVNYEQNLEEDIEVQ
ncbi:UPF0182 family membrane protein [Clostridiisalibacter paucivorans]|uniref:UPF0182 family membrane protein n=1 Tax=Clostridiisalibacter paucivorans TaxID=408753 RepID=UPI00047D5C0E|nr:UPF0182 family protein [Clostridiisalibacter paucivorans]